MSDPTLSEALQEAYASAPSDQPIIETLSLWHPGLEVEGEASELYLYNGFTGDRLRADGVAEKDFRLEAAARLFPGAVVAFVAIPFSVVLPSVASQQIAKGKLVIDGVGREVADIMIAASAAGAEIEITYREYLEGLEDDGPQNDPPLVFTLQNVTCTATQASGDISVAAIGNRRFPRERYESSRFPSLRS